MAKKPEWLWSRGAALLLVGFAVNLSGLVGGAFWLDPAQRAVESASLDMALQTARARIIRAATASDELAEHMGSLVFSVPSGADQPDEVRATMSELFRRALDRRHNAVRAYLAELALARAVDFDAELKRYEALVAAEKADFNLETYRAVNSFEADLAMAMVKTEGDAAMRAIVLQKTRREAKVEEARRRLALTLVAIAGSAIVLVAALAGGRSAAPAPHGATQALAAALKRLQSQEVAGDARKTGVP